MTRAVETADVVVVGSGFGGAIPAFHLAAGGAKVVVLERGPRLSGKDFEHSMKFDTWTRYVDLVVSRGLLVVAANCVGGGSVHYFAASLRAPSFAFERKGGAGKRLWPASLTRSALDPWYDRVEESIPVAKQEWTDVPYAGGVFAAACEKSGRTCNPVPVAVDLNKCTNCNFMTFGCRFDAKRSMILNYLPAAEAHGATIKPLHEVQSIGKAETSGYRYRLNYSTLDSKKYFPTGSGAIEAKVVVLAAGAMATPIVLQRSAMGLGGMPAAVGKHFSPNGDMLVAAQMNEEKIKSVLGLQRPDGTAYEAHHIGKAINAQTMDKLDPNLPEFSRFVIQQCYFPPLVNLFPIAGDGLWFGREKKEARRNWRSWMGTLTMYEDDNEGLFAVPPTTGAFIRYAVGVGLSTLSYSPNANTKRAKAAALAENKAIMEHAGIGKMMPYTEDLYGPITAHPLSSARIGDDPATSALNDRHELRGHEGIFVTDSAAVPGALCVNPSLTIASLAERASPFIIERLASYGVNVKYAGSKPDGSKSTKREALPLITR